nr:hypothetical protein [Streptomyces violaceoruber]
MIGPVLAPACGNFVGVFAAEEGYAPLAEARDVYHQLGGDGALADYRLSISRRLVRAPQEAADLGGGVLEDAAGQVLVAAAHPGGLAGLPAHHGVDDRVGDAEDEQDGRRGVAGVADAGGPQ